MMHVGAGEARFMHGEKSQGSVLPPVSSLQIPFLWDHLTANVQLWSKTAQRDSPILNASDTIKYIHMKDLRNRW